MAVNKVVYGGTNLIDLTTDTVSPDTMFEGTTAHNAAGERISGTVVTADIVDDLTSERTDAALSANAGRIVNETAEAAMTAASEATTIAKGRNKARVFTTTQDMNAWLSDPQNKGVAQLGDNLYVVEVDVPDWWVSEVLDSPNESGRYYEIAQLETQKVDLTTIEAAIRENTSDINKANILLGDTDISEIGDGTVTGAISALNSNLHYTFQSINNEYFVSQGFSIIERSGVMYVGSTMQLTKSLPEWTSITIGKINDWDKGVRTLGFPSSLYGTNSVTIRLTIDQDGNVEAHTHGAVDIGNPMWLYSSNCFVI